MQSVALQLYRVGRRVPLGVCLTLMFDFGLTGRLCGCDGCNISSKQPQPSSIHLPVSHVQAGILWRTWPRQQQLRRFALARVWLNMAHTVELLCAAAQLQQACCSAWCHSWLFILHGDTPYTGSVLVPLAAVLVWPASALGNCSLLCSSADVV